MAASSILGNGLFTWGDSVRVSREAPPEYHPQQAGSVCGVREAKGDILYLVEFKDGTAKEIPEKYLHCME